LRFLPYLLGFIQATELSSPETTPTTDPAYAQQRGLFFFFSHRLREEKCFCSKGHSSSQKISSATPDRILYSVDFPYRYCRRLVRSLRHKRIRSPKNWAQECCAAVPNLVGTCLYRDSQLRANERCSEQPFSERVKVRGSQLYSLLGRRCLVSKDPMPLRHLTRRGSYTPSSVARVLALVSVPPRRL
jgi:hypothetical protein